MFLQITTNLTTDRQELDEMFLESVETFQNLSETFQEFIEAVDEYSYLYNASGIGFSFDYSNELFQDGFFENVTTENLETKQDTVIDLMDETGENFTRIFSVFFAWRQFYNLTNTLYLNSSSVDSIYEDVRLSLARSIDNDVVWVGNQIQARDIVCYIAMAHSQYQDTYDYYDLTIMFDTYCDINETVWLDMYSNAYALRLAAEMSVEVEVSISHNHQPYI